MTDQDDPNEVPPPFGPAERDDLRRELEALGVEHSLRRLLSGADEVPPSPQVTWGSLRERIVENGRAVDNRGRLDDNQASDSSSVQRPSTRFGEYSKEAARRSQIHGRRTPRLAGYVAIAGAIMIAAVSTIPYARRSLSPKAPTSTFKEISTAPGQRARVTLPDNSTVLLAPQSKIRYATNFGTSSDRTVALDGQALFTVTHSTGAPFVVQAGGTATRVLGTSFTVRRYSTDDHVQVVVAQGRVSVGKTLVGTGDVATAMSPDQVIVSRGQAVAEQLAWAEGRLIFSGVTLRDAVPVLERWYGINITVTDRRLLDRIVVTTLDTETAAEAVSVVAAGINGSVEFSAGHATIHSR